VFEFGEDHLSLDRMTNHGDTPQKSTSFRAGDDQSSSSGASLALQAPMISVCMPVYNAKSHVAEAIESILNQRLGDFEFLIFDDGSTDGSIDVLKHYESLDPRIRLFSRPNKGLVTTLNELIDQARGEFLARMDADDIALPERFGRQVDYLRAHPEYVLVGSRVLLIDPEGDPLCDWCTLEDQDAIDARFLTCERITTISHPAVMMRRDAVLAIGKYRPFEVIEDIDLFLRLSEYGRITNLPEVLLKYRIHAGNISKTATYHKIIDRVYGEIASDARRRRNLAELPTLPESPHVETSITAEREKWAWWALTAGHVRTARKHARWVLANAPFSIRSWNLAYCALRGY
jgi:glycosyltransferase involved in cell wall biosynthesis